MGGSPEDFPPALLRTTIEVVYVLADGADVLFYVVQERRSGVGELRQVRLSDEASLLLVVLRVLVVDHVVYRIAGLVSRAPTFRFVFRFSFSSSLFSFAVEFIEWLSKYISSAISRSRRFVKEPHQKLTEVEVVFEVIHNQGKCFSSHKPVDDRVIV